MRDEMNQTEGDRPLREGRWNRRLWFIAMTVVAAGLWVQLLAPGVAAELESDDGSELVALIQLLPLIAAVVAVVWRHPAGRLAVYPISFVPGLALMSQVEWEALSGGQSLVAAVVTFGVYLALAAGRPEEMIHRGEDDVRPAQTPPGDEYARRFRRFVLVRFAAVAVLFVAISWALFFAAPIQESLAGLDGADAARSQHLFMVVALYLGWMVAVYMAAILPALNWEYHRRRSALPQRQRRLLGEPGRLRTRISVWLVALLVGTLLSVWWLI